MTYFGVLLRFVGPPLVILAAITVYDLAHGKRMPSHYRTWPAWAVFVGHIAIALVYTTPWDNYLVATRVWWYEPSLVTGITLGWVPIEEYTFFVVQTMVAGLWLLAIMRRLRRPEQPFVQRRALRWSATTVGAILWAGSLASLLIGWAQGEYMALIGLWFLPPILLQFVFGADILWHYRRLVLYGILPPFVYLCLVDAIAIHSGTWTINPDNILGVYLSGVLPLEEMTFFLVTNVLIVFGMVLMLAIESHVRAGTRPGKVWRELQVDQ